MTGDAASRTAMPPARDPDAYREASDWYLAGRPPYSSDLLATMRRELGLDGSGGLLDVGCGPGVVLLALAPAFEAASLAALDPDPGMLAVARRRAEAAGVEVRWIRGVAEDIPHLELGPRTLVTFGQSFHWTAGVPVLDAVYDLLEPGGTVALIGHRVEGRPVPDRPEVPRIPEDEIMELVAQFAGERAEPPSPRHRSTPHLHEETLCASQFGNARLVYADGRPDVVRDEDSVVAGYYSTSYAAPRRFGPRRDEFESALRSLLRRHSPEGRFWDWPGDTEILLATRDATARATSLRS
jgi:SAM-dependent methyltransferase